MNKTCKTCGFLNPMQLVCQLSGLKMDPAADTCSRHNTDPIKCTLCGNLMLKEGSIIDVTDGNNILMCINCLHKISSCAFCKNGIECKFETDPSPIPLVIQKQIRQGPMVQIVTVKNPDRIAITCKMGCPCYDAQNDCQRQFNYCANQEFRGV